MSFTVRAVTLHAGSLDPSDDEGVESAVARLQEAVDRSASRLGLRPTYIRLAMRRPEGELGRVVKQLERLSSQVAINVGQLQPNVSPGDLEALSSAGLYASILLPEPSWGAAKAIASSIIGMSSSDPSLATRVAVNVMGEEGFVTPYYPLASARPRQELVTVALTYPSYLAQAYRSGGLGELTNAIVNAARAAEELGRSVASELGAEYAGVDLSVSPWMEDSSLALVEEVAGVRMPRPGFTSGVRAVNEAIARASASVKAVGFNEVMLPVGEDSKLKARVSEGEVNARYLAMLSGVCVAGLDMVAVPADEAGIAGLILDVASYSRAKGRTLGVRVIPVEGAEPGDKVDLGRFGESPIIAI